MPLPPRPSRRWIEPPAVPDDEAATLVDELGLPGEICELLVRRGHGDPASARRFLRPTFARLHPPRRLPDLDAAVERIHDAARRRARVLVHGDYDADGVCAAALLVRGLGRLGAEPVPFVPHRLRDGYDLGEAGVARAAEAGAELIVTADCGIAAREAVAAAAGEGIDVVVTDHHRPPERLPEAAALVNPGRDGSSYPFPGLSGAGVAFKLLRALWEADGRPPEELNRHLDLVALGTVADLVPLEDENRVLVRAGLRALEKSRKPGVRALLETAGVEGRELAAGDVSYRLGPRINAAGRVGDAGTALRLLLTDDREEADRLARTLEDHNRERRTEDRRVQREAEERLARDYDPDRDRAVVVWGDDWHPGVIGVAASRVVDRVHRPAVLLTFREGAVGRGSGRSVPGFDLHAALAECDGLLERFGGHRRAAGLEIRRENVEAFAGRLGEVARRELDPDDLAPRLRLDLEVPLARVDGDLHRWLRHLAPFGAGNPEPVLASRPVRFLDARRVGSGDEHLKGTLAGPEGGRLPAIGFGLGDRAEEVASGSDDAWEVAYELAEDVWRGRRRLQARIRDLRPAGDGRAGR